MILNNKLLRCLQKKDLKSSIMGLYNDYMTLPIDLLNKFKILLLMHKYTHYKETLPLVSDNYFALNRSAYDHNTRNSNDFHLEASQSSFGLRSIRHIGPTLWNSLPITLKVDKNVNSFKEKLYNYFINAQ